MAQVDSPPRTNLALQPSPVLMEAVLKVWSIVRTEMLLLKFDKLNFEHSLSVVIF